MILSKTNIIATNTLSVTAGTVADGDITNTQDPDFSSNVTSNSATFTIRVASVGSIEYIALHGLDIPIGCTVTVSGTGLSESFTTTRAVNNLVFYVSSAVTPGNMDIEFSGGGTKTISYIQAGLATTIDWGTNPGQPLYYLASQKRSRVTVDANGYPLKRVQEMQIPKLRLTIRHALKSWVRGDLQTVRDMYDTTGILSQLDYEDDGRPDESCCLYELDNFDVTTHSQTTELVNVALSFRALA